MSIYISFFDLKIIPMILIIGTLIVFPMKNASKEFAKQFVILMPLVDLIRYVKIGYVILVVEVITLVRKTKLALIINAKVS